MKLNTIKQLILRFIGGGKIQIPTRFLKSIDIESPDMKSDVTVDDITTELLENEDIINKIVNFGLTDEEIQKLPKFSNFDHDAASIEQEAFASYDTSDIVDAYTLSYNDFTMVRDINEDQEDDYVEKICTVLKENDYICVYTRLGNYVVFKKKSISNQNNQNIIITYETFGNSHQRIRFEIQLYYNAMPVARIKYVSAGFEF